MNKTEKRVIENVIRRLRGENCSEEVAEALTKVCGIYLESWVIAALEILVREGVRDLRLADSLVELRGKP